MAETREQPAVPARAGRLAPALVLTPILPVLVVLMVYFATRPESDWVLVLAMGLCATGIVARLAGALRPRRRR